MKTNKKTEALNIKVSKEMKNKLEKQSLELDVSIGHIVRQSILKQLNNK
jgi:hypothetical protein